MFTVRPIDCGPGSDIPSRNKVCKTSVSAGSTAEAVATTTIRAGDMPAEWACLARVSRIDENNRDSSPLCLVLDKGLELVETPIGQSWSLSARGRYPRADILEVFKSNRSVGAFRLVHNGFRNAVVDIALVAGLAARNGAELPGCGSCLLSLEVASAVRKGSSDLFDLFTGEALPVRIVGNVNNAHIDADCIDWFDAWGLVNVTGHDNVEFTTLELKVNLTFAPDQHLALILTADKGDLDATINRPDRDDVIVADSEDSAIEWLSSQWSEGMFLLAFSLIAGRDLSNTEGDELGRKPGFLSDLVVNQVVNRVSRKCFLVPSALADLATGGVSSLQRLQQEVPLFLCGQEFDWGYEFHVTHATMETL